MKTELKNSREKRCNSPLVSFIITTKNEEKHIGKCLRSIRNQTYENTEIVLVDALSEDKTVNNARKYVDTLLIKECNMPRGRNIGAKHAKGDILAFVDADTTLMPDWLERLLARLNENKTVAACGDLFPRKVALKDMLLYEWINVIDNLFLKKLGYGLVARGGTACIIRRDVFQEVRGYDETSVACEDILFSKKVSELGKIALERKARGFFSVRFFEKYGYLRRLWYQTKRSFDVLIRQKRFSFYKR